MNPTCEPQRSKQEKPPLSPAGVGKIRGFFQTVNGTMEQGSVAVVLDGHLDKAWQDHGFPASSSHF
jgi:hypothetical protein